MTTVVALARPAALAAGLRRSRATLREFDAIRRTPRTSLDRVVGPGAGWAWCTARLDALRDVAHAHGATVNDVLLTRSPGGCGRSC